MGITLKCNKVRSIFLDVQMHLQDLLPVVAGEVPCHTPELEITGPDSGNQTNHFLSTFSN